MLSKMLRQIGNFLRCDMKKIEAIVLVLSILITSFAMLTTAYADNTATLTTDKTTYTEGESIFVTASSANSSGKDWVGITVKGDTANPAIYWDYINVFSKEYDIRTASHKGKNRNNYYDLPAGEYTVFIMPDDLTVKEGYSKIIKKIDITIVADPNKPNNEPPVLTLPDKDTYLITDKTEYLVGEPIYVAASSINAGKTDWVGIWPKGETGASIYWEYLVDIGKGVTFNIKRASHSGSSRTEYYGIPAGEYTLYLIPDNLNGTPGIPKALASVDIKVVADPSKIAKAPVSAEYALKDPKSGMADGTLTINLPADHCAEDIYMWWANDAGKLPGYTGLGRFKVTGTKVVHEMTPNTLIPKGATKLLIYTSNDGNGLSADYLEVKLPEGAASGDLGEVISEFQVVSDIHIKSTATHEYSIHFVSMLKDVVKNSPNSIGIISVGDNVDRGDNPMYWTYFHSLYNSVQGAPPMYLGIGNHEYIGTNYNAGLSGFLENVKLPDGSTPDKPYYDFWLNGYHYVYIGSDTTGSSTLKPDQLKWLDQTLAENRDGRPIFLFHHQPMLNTVSGSSTSEGWSGISNYTQLKAVLDKYPEVVMFNGHTHWILNSDNCMYDGKGETATIFNTASVAYLWHSYDIAGGERQTGSEGYYVRIYKDKLAVLGRDFVTGEWVSSAQFIVNLSTKTEDDVTTKDDETTASAPESGDATTEISTSAPAPETTSAPDTGSADNAGCGSTVSAPIAILSVIIIGVAITKKRD